jgi:SAM-dependent methyltransferase
MEDWSRKRLLDCIAVLQEYRLETYGNSHKTIMTQTTPAHEEIGKLITDLCVESVLEIGCAVGALKNAISFPPSVSYRGIDPLRLKDIDYDFPFLETFLEDMPMDFAKGVDCVVIKDSIDYFFDINISISKISNILKNTGFFILSEGGRGSEINNYSQGFIETNNYELHDEGVLRTYPQGRLNIKDIFSAINTSGFVLIRGLLSADDRGILVFQK